MSIALYTVVMPPTPIRSRMEKRPSSTSPCTSSSFTFEGLLLRILLIELEIEHQHVHAGLAQESVLAAFGVPGDERLHLIEGQVTLPCYARRLDFGVPWTDVRID